MRCVFTAICKIRVLSAHGRGKLLHTAIARARSRTVSTSSVVFLSSPPPQTEQLQQAEVERHAHSLPPHLRSPLEVREAVATALDDSKVQ